VSVAATALDPRQSPALARELPGLDTLFDADAMSLKLEDVLLGSSHSRFEIERCRPGQAIYRPGDGCMLRYELELRDRASGGAFPALVNGRVFRSPQICRNYVSERLAPLVERARGRPELEPFAKPAAVLEDLPAAVCVFPLDGELLTLSDVTDPRLMGGILDRAISEGVSGPINAWQCRVERAHRGRRHCALRYESGPVDGASRERLLVYGKVAADERGAIADEAMRRLRGRIVARQPESLKIPASLGFHRNLRLLLLEAMPGAATMGDLLKTHARGEQLSGTGPVLESAVEACASVAAALHASEVELGPRRDAGRELSSLRADIAALSRISPELGARLLVSLETAEDRLLRSPALPPSICHGDFRHTQILFDRESVTLVDFDSVCQAEPALDLGHFLAYLRLTMRKVEPAIAGGARVNNALSQLFLNRYLLADRLGLSEARVRARVAAYETLSLLRLALHGWQKFKPHRVEVALSLLEEA
jgi:phosphotransferase family enzyme